MKKILILFLVSGSLFLVNCGGDLEYDTDGGDGYADNQNTKKKSNAGSRPPARNLLNDSIKKSIRSTMGKAPRNVSHIYRCKADGVSRVYKLNLYEVGHPSGLSCQVLGNGSSLWSARNERDYCARNLLGIIDKMSASGLRCEHSGAAIGSTERFKLAPQQPNVPTKVIRPHVEGPRKSVAPTNTFKNGPPLTAEERREANRK